MLYAEAKCHSQLSKKFEDIKIISQIFWINESYKQNQLTN